MAAGAWQGLGKFAKQIEKARWIWLSVIGLALVVSIGLDLATDVWDCAPFLTNVISSLLLLGLTVLLIDEYLSFRAARTWEPVAAFALEDLGRVVRAVWVRNASFIQPQHEAMGIVQFRQQIQSAEGRSQQEQALRQIVAERNRREDLYNVLYETGVRTREVLMNWAPVMVSRGPLAEHLSQYSQLHRRIVQVLAFLHREVAGGALEIEPAEIKAKVLEIQDLAIALDHQFFAEAERTAPLFPTG